MRYLRNAPLFLAIVLMTAGARSWASGNTSKTQAQAAYGDNASAQTSAGAGRTYDNSSAASNVNAGGSPSVSYNSGALPTAYNGPDILYPNQNVPTPNSVNATPWQNQIDTATFLVVVALGLWAIGSYVKLPGTSAKKIIGAAIAALGLALVSIGSSIQKLYGQTMQGGLLMVLGMGFVVLGMKMAFDNSGDKNTAKDTATKTETNASQTAAQQMSPNTASQSASSLTGNASQTVASKGGECTAQGDVQNFANGAKTITGPDGKISLVMPSK